MAVAGPLRRTFVYRQPASIERLEAGQRVLVPFGAARKIGYYLGGGVPGKGVRVKEIVKVIDDATLFSPELFKLCLWMADYYFANPADCLAAALPPILKTKRKPTFRWGDAPLELDKLPSWVAPLIKEGHKIPTTVLQRIKGEGRGLFDRMRKSGLIAAVWAGTGAGPKGAPIGFRAVSSDAWKIPAWRKGVSLQPFDGVKTRTQLKAVGWSEYRIGKAVKSGLLEPVYSEGLSEVMEFVRPREHVAGLQLNGEQRSALDKLSEFLDKGFSTTLLHGITGSGKTLVYCHLCREVLGRGKTVLALTPEIALAGTTLAYFRAFFGDQVTVLHSAMTERERLQSWYGIRQGKYRIVIGPRSAVFAPQPDLGLIIVDEEHDGSYKQDDPAPRFHGRDCAIMRARINGVPALLGSASPSVETYHHVRSEKYHLATLATRPTGARLPIVHLVDMRSERVRGDLPFMSYTLKKEVQGRLTRGEQVILYLNRRGHSPMLKCAGCGFLSRCPQCQVNLTYHKTGPKLSCHYCGHTEPSYSACPSCGGSEFLYLGSGTQKVEEAIPCLFEGATPVRFDSDAVTGRAKAYRILTDFSSRKYNLLLGTQMVTKGLDLPGVTLVGVLAADMSLDLPDFRSSEKTFAQLLQVAGRSGRAETPGEVFIQTYYADNDVINDAAAQHYETFFEREIESRRRFRYPPFVRLINCLLSGSDEKRLESATLSFRNQLADLVRRHRLKADLLGPAPCPLYFLRGQYRRHLLVKTGQIVKFTTMLSEWEHEQSRFGIPSAIKIVIDVDPDDMM